MKKIFATLAALFIATAAHAQSAGTVTANAFAIGKGPGVTGYGSVLCTAAQLPVGQAAAPICRTMSGDATFSAAGALTLATVNAGVGSFGSATQCAAFTVNGKGLITAASQALCTPAIGSITGLGTGVAAALATNIGSAGAPVLFNGAGGTPSSMVGTNITGTAAGLTAGNVTTNANLTGPVTSVGNATSIANNAITNAMIRQGVARSVVGVTGNATANVADIQAAASQFLVANSAGTALVFAALAGDCTNSGSTLTCGQTGTWTPTIVGSVTPGAGQTYSTQAGTYQRIGREVILHFSLVVTGLGTAAGNAQIGGLPFASTATANIFGHCIVASYSVASLPASNFGINGSIAQSASVIDLQTSGAAGSSAITITNVGAAFIARGTCSYQTT